MNNNLRKEVKLLKVLQGISYKEIAEEYLGLKRDSFYAWLNGYYDLGIEKQQLLLEIVSNLKES